MSSTIGCVLPAGVGGSIKRVIIEDLDDLQRLVGGNIEPLTAQASEDLFITMLINEDGREKDLEMNWIASALFMREIVGDVVLVRSVDENGVLADDFMDLPTEFITWLEERHMPRVADSYNKTMMVSAIFKFAVMENLIPEEEVDDFLADTMVYLEGGEVTAEEQKRTTEFIDRVVSIVDEKVSNGLGDELANEIYEFLDKGGK
jgi:hypothetical protein